MPTIPRFIKKSKEDKSNTFGVLEKAENHVPPKSIVRTKLEEHIEKSKKPFIQEFDEEPYTITTNYIKPLKTGSITLLSKKNEVAMMQLDSENPLKDLREFLESFRNSNTNKSLRRIDANKSLTLMGNININLGSQEQIKNLTNLFQDLNIKVLEAKPGSYQIDKAYGGLVDNPQITTAFVSDVTMQDGILALEFIDENISEEERNKNSEHNQKILKELQKAVQKLPIKKYVTDFAAAHSPVCTIKNDKMYVAANLMSTATGTNHLYIAENYEKLCKAGNALSNAQWRFFVQTLLLTNIDDNSLCINSQQNAVWKWLNGKSSINLKNIDFNSDEQVQGLDMTSIELRTILEQLIKQIWKKYIKDYPQDHLDIFRGFVNKFYDFIHQSPEFKAYVDLLLDNPRCRASVLAKTRVKQANITAQCLELYKDYPFTIMTFMIMGKLKSGGRVDLNNFMEHKYFDYPLCYQINGGFPSFNQTQEVIDVRQVMLVFAEMQNCYLLREINLSKTSAKNQKIPIEALSVLKCNRNDHSEIFYKLFRKIVELSIQKPLIEIDFKEDVLKAIDYNVSAEVWELFTLRSQHNEQFSFDNYSIANPRSCRSSNSLRSK